MKKKALLLILLVLILIGGGIALYAANREELNSQNSSQNSTDQPTDQTPGPGVTKTGTFGCLTMPGGGPQTMECAFGLTQDDGTKYALYATDPMMLAGLTNQRIEVTGTITEQTTKYQTAGTINVTSVRKL